MRVSSKIIAGLIGLLASAPGASAHLQFDHLWQPHGFWQAAYGAVGSLPRACALISSYNSTNTHYGVVLAAGPAQDGAIQARLIALSSNFNLLRSDTATLSADQMFLVKAPIVWRQITPDDVNAVGGPISLRDFQRLLVPVLSLGQTMTLRTEAMQDSFPLDGFAAAYPDFQTCMEAAFGG
jgi:hypothetical protein